MSEDEEDSDDELLWSSLDVEEIMLWPRFDDAAPAPPLIPPTALLPLTPFALLLFANELRVVVENDEV